jgi:hypothetical protein
LACALCNNAKSNKFTYGEFKRVGDVIKEIWQQRREQLEEAVNNPGPLQPPEGNEKD